MAQAMRHETGDRRRVRLFDHRACHDAFHRDWSDVNRHLSSALMVMSPDRKSSPSACRARLACRSLIFGFTGPVTVFPPEDPCLVPEKACGLQVRTNWFAGAMPAVQSFAVFTGSITTWVDVDATCGRVEIVSPRTARNAEMSRVRTFNR